MEGFDTITMSYLAAPMQLSHVTQDSLNVSLLPHEHYEQHSNYDAETFAGSEDAPYTAHSLQPANLQRYSSNFEDPFSDALSAYDQQPQHDGSGALDSPSIDSNNKLLSFTLPSYNYQLLDYAFRRTSINISAQLHGMFFLAESPWAGAGDGAGPPSELTCYRRNLFQITGQITLPRALQYILTEKGEQMPIVGQELTISASESVEGNSVKIISVPWKTPATSQPVVEDKVEKEPPSIPLDLSNGQEMDSEFVNFPIAWKRLQFRIATANNGRRKELQQHFVVRLKLVVTLTTGTRVSVAEVQSGAIIVRGRSPRNFQSRKDFPIGAGGGSARKNSHLSSQAAKKAAAETVQAAKQQHQNERQEAKATRPDIPAFPYQYDNTNAIDMGADFLDWKVPNQPGAMTAIPNQAYVNGQNGQGYAQTTPDLSRLPAPTKTPQAPISLSLTEDEPRKSASPHVITHKAPKLTPNRSHSFGLNMISSPDEGADMLYEYFPLALDDWMPPVDAVYRPHVVHHTNLPQDPKLMAVKNRSKRYFSESEAP